MANASRKRLLPYTLPALACGNLLWLNLSLAPAVFASESADGPAKRSAQSDGQSQVALRASEPAEAPFAATDSQAATMAEPAARSAGANKSAEALPEASESELRGRCDNSASHETLALLNFATNVAELDAQAMQTLTSLAQELGPEHATLWVDGHADQRGKVARNKELSRLRAQNITNSLIELGVDSERIEMRAFGEATPKTSRQMRALWKNRQAAICIEKASL